MSSYVKDKFASKDPLSKIFGKTLGIKKYLLVEAYNAGDR